MSAQLLLLVLLQVAFRAQSASVGVATGPEAVPQPTHVEKIPAAPATSNSIQAVSTSPSGGGGANDLLDPKKLPFLADCKSPKDHLCKTYTNLSMELAARHITPDAINEELSKKDATSGDQFCDNLAAVLQNLKASGKVATDTATSKLADSRTCTVICSSVDPESYATTVKPICRVLLWGFRQVVSQEALAKSDDPLENVGVLKPQINENLKLAPVGKETAEADSKSAAATKPITSNVTKPAASAPPSATGADKSAVADKPAPADIVPADSPKQDKPQQPAVASTPKKTSEDEKAQEEVFLDPESKNDQNINEINNNGEVEDIIGEDGGTDQFDSDEESMMDTEPQTAQPVKQQKDQEHQQRQQPLLSSQFEEEPPNPKVAPVPQEQFQDDPGFFDDGQSNFFSYFLFAMFACIVCYVGYHNKSKVLALVVEGRRSSSGRGGFSKSGGGGRKHTAAYRKLDSNLEEAITSNAAASSRSTSQIIY